MFQILSKNKQLVKERQRSEALKAQQARVEAASSIAFVKLAEAGEIDGVTATEHTDLFSEWADQVTYAVGAIRQHEGRLYRCVQEHTAQGDWTPDKTPALWAQIGDPTAASPEWSQPIGAHDAYDKGDQVSHKCKQWTSTEDANVWEPGVFGWEELQ